MKLPFLYKLLMVAIAIGPWFVCPLANAVCPMTKVNSSACALGSPTTACDDYTDMVACPSQTENVKQNDAFSCRSSTAMEECLDAAGTTWCYTHYECIWTGAMCEINLKAGTKYYDNFKYTSPCP